jgi:hypothetical protein
MSITYAQWMNKFSKAINIIQEIGMCNALEFAGNTFITRYNNLKTMTAKMLLHSSLNQQANALETYITSKVLSEGPKVFRPTQIDFELLEEMRVSLEFEDYVQPFPTMVIELPDSYIKNKRVVCPQAGKIINYAAPAPELHNPMFVVVRHEPKWKVILIQIVFDSEVSIKTLMLPKEHTIIEEYIKGISASEEYAGSLYTTPEEWDVATDVMRAALNYCLLVDEVGAKKQGPDNVSNYNRFERYVKVAQKTKDKARIEKAAAELLREPVLYTLKQEVKLYRVVSNPSELPVESTGRVVSPHHRRGFYKMQPHGPGNSLRKRIRIPPVFVNKHLYLGEMKDASATYHS